MVLGMQRLSCVCVRVCACVCVCVCVGGGVTQSEVCAT